MSKSNKPIGTQLLAELWDCNTFINDPDKIKEVVVEAANIAGANIIESFFHKFEPFGITGVLVISESHISIHTWPEYSYIAIDIFTCGERLDPWKALEYLVSIFEAKDTNTIEIKRGLRNRSLKPVKNFD